MIFSITGRAICDNGIIKCRGKAFPASRLQQGRGKEGLRGELTVAYAMPAHQSRGGWRQSSGAVASISLAIKQVWQSANLPGQYQSNRGPASQTPLKQPSKSRRRGPARSGRNTPVLVTGRGLRWGQRGCSGWGGKWVALWWRGHRHLLLSLSKRLDF